MPCRLGTATQTGLSCTREENVEYIGSDQTAASLHVCFVTMFDTNNEAMDSVLTTWSPALRPVYIRQSEYKVEIIHIKYTWLQSRPL